MEFKELIRERKSIRKYTEEEIDLKTFEEIIKGSQMAPSWKNSQTARYYLAYSDEARKAVYEALPEFNQNSSKNAYYIIATFKKGISGDGTKEADYWGSYDLGLQNAYLVLMAKELGYDTLIMGLRDDEALRKYFEIPNDEVILPVIALGKKDQDPSPRPRKELDEILKKL